ncbi:MAG TPA: Bpu10I family restriction endonuclease [Clostridiales bacterium]|nr:Bpu10I family restriction endonuclease [Clostridiales bacterium]
MIFMHENNLLTKIQTNYKGIGRKIEEFYNQKYKPIREKLLSFTFTVDNHTDFINATRIFNDYYDELKNFARTYSVTSQSKFESTFLEEMNSYLFKDLPEIRSGDLGVYNKRIFAGMIINNDKTIKVITKDVDFCIGKGVNISIDNQPAIHLVLPVVAVEVKTFLDATMFGEVKSSSKAIRNASPNAKTYVLMGYRSLSDVHIISARNDAALTEMFALRESADAPMRAEVIRDYWLEIRDAVQKVSSNTQVNTFGRLLY